jgi:hypothetical protein
MSRRHSSRATIGTRRREAVTECSCGKPTRDGAYICEDCLDGITADLRDLLPSGDTEPGLWVELGSSVAGERGIDYRALGGASGGSDATGLVLDEVAVARGRRVLDVLRGMARLCVAHDVRHSAPLSDDAMSDRPRPGADVPELAEWLLWRVTDLAWHPEFTKAPVALEKAVRGIRATVMPLPHRQWLGSCPVNDCDGTLHARRDETFAECSRCGAFVEAKAQREWLIGHIEDQLCTAAEIAVLYDPDPAVRIRTRKRCNQWARRGRLLDPRVIPWEPGVCPWPSPADLVFRFGDAFDLLVEEDHRHQNNPTNSTEEPR